MLFPSFHLSLPLSLYTQSACSVSSTHFKWIRHRIPAANCLILGFLVFPQNRVDSIFNGWLITAQFRAFTKRLYDITDGVTEAHGFPLLRSNEIHRNVDTNIQHTILLRFKFTNDAPQTTQLVMLVICIEYMRPDAFVRLCSVDTVWVHYYERERVCMCVCVCVRNRMNDVES